MLKIVKTEGFFFAKWLSHIQNPSRCLLLSPSLARFAFSLGPRLVRRFVRRLRLGCRLPRARRDPSSMSSPLPLACQIARSRLTSPIASPPLCLPRLLAASLPHSCKYNGDRNIISSEDLDIKEILS